MTKDTTEPKAGEWWWVERGCETTPARKLDGLGWYVFGEPDRLCNVRPIARIPDPPAPEPTDAEKIDARRAEVARQWFSARHSSDLTRLVRTIRASDEAAGYVLVPTSGEGFERRLTAAKRATVYRGDIYSPATVMVEDGIRAFLEAAKGDAR